MCKYGYASTSRRRCLVLRPHVVRASLHFPCGQLTVFLLALIQSYHNRSIIAVTDHSNQKSRSRSEIVGFFATISLIRTYPFSKYLDLATTILEIARYRFHSSRDSQIAKTTSYAARISNVENRVPRSALFATIWSSSDRFSKLLRYLFDRRVAQMLRNPGISKRDPIEIAGFRYKQYCEILGFG